MAESTQPSYALVHPTPAQFERQYALNCAVWHGPLNLEAYMRRERLLATQGIAGDSGLTYWALIDKNEDPGSDKILAGCETLRKKALIAKNGHVMDVTAHGIASVFTPPDARGKGHATVMMHQVAELLKTWQSGFSVLFSDIGKTFYAREGWHPYPSSHVHLPPNSAPKVDGGQLPTVAALYDKDLEALCVADEALLRGKLARHQGSVAVALLPDHATMIWHHVREDFVANELHGKTPTARGAIATVDGIRVWAIWSRLFYNPDVTKSKGNTLHILRLVIEDSDADARSEAHIAGIAAVLSSAQKEAREWKMNEVELWNPHEQSIEAAQRLHPEAKVVHRDSESITSLKWYGDSADEASLVWTDNEKYGWC